VWTDLAYSWRFMTIHSLFRLLSGALRLFQYHSPNFFLSGSRAIRGKRKPPLAHFTDIAQPAVLNTRSFSAAKNKKKYHHRDPRGPGRRILDYTTMRLAGPDLSSTANIGTMRPESPDEPPLSQQPRWNVHRRPRRSRLTQPDGVRVVWWATMIIDGFEGSLRHLLRPRTFSSTAMAMGP